jgi:hypothetical protein
MTRRRRETEPRRNAGTCGASRTAPRRVTRSIGGDPPAARSRGLHFDRVVGPVRAGCRRTMIVRRRPSRDAGDPTRTRHRPGSMKRRLVVITLSVVLSGALGVAGCGGSTGSQTGPGTGTGEAAKTPQQILSDAKVAVGTASSVHMVGQVPNTSTPITVNFALSAARGMTGTILFNGAPAQLVRVGATLYVRGPLSFYAAIGAPTAAISLLAGRWISAPVTSPALAPFRSFLPLTDYHQLWATVLNPTAHPITHAGAGTLGATPVVYLRDAKKNMLAISNLGTAYPVGVLPPSGRVGQLMFGPWNAPVAVRVPHGAVSLVSITG